MKIKSLTHTPLSEIVDCLLDAFSEYPVKMPESEAYWKKRYDIAQVDYNLSFGAFDHDRLVGFVINGVAKKDGKMIAFNTGTGVRKQFRGKAITQKIYNYSYPFLKEAGITHCQLEVLDDNEKAIHVYKKSGFKITRRMHCYQGMLNELKSQGVELKEVSFEEYFHNNDDNKRYSWDFDRTALTVAGKQYSYYKALHNNQYVGQFVVDRERQYLAQFNFANEKNGLLTFKAVSEELDFIKVINIDEQYRLANDILHKIKLNKFVSQYEMEFEL